MMDVSYISYYRVNKYLLSLIGQWPYQRMLRKHSLASFAYIVFTSFFLAQSAALAKAWGDVDNTIECIPAIFVNLAAIILMTSCIYNQQKMELIFSKIQKDWTTWSAGSEVEILHTYARNGEIFSVTFTCCIYFTFLFYAAVPITPQILDFIMPLNETRPKKFYCPAEYFVDPQEYFYWTLLHAYAAGFLCTTTIISVDTIFMTFLHHACGIFAILGFRLESLLKKTDDFNIDKVKFREEIDYEIKFCAEKHESAIMFVHDMCESFSTAFFLVLGFNMLIMSVTGVQTVMKLDDPREAMRFAVFTVGEMFHLVYLSIPCQQLIDHSFNISDSIYSGHWYQLPPSSQKLLLMIMKRSSKVCTFTAGKVYVFSMENCASILQTSMSYFTVLMSVR